MFDQYEQEENRLTHALLVSLEKDSGLLRDFLIEFLGISRDPRQVQITEQGFPGATVDTPQEAESRGLPDGCLSDGSGWALLVESKVTAPVKAEQLRRHLSTARRYGLESAQLLVLCIKNSAVDLPKGTLVRRWSDVYVWLLRHARTSDWARWCAEYFEVAEAKFRLLEGTLTVFSGITFDDNTPYSYLQAKRLLGLLRAELVRDQRLSNELGADLKSDGRGSITGIRSDSVWDYMGLRQSGSSPFNHFPHLTFSIHSDQLQSYVTIPNSVKPAIRRRILTDEYDTFSTLIESLARNMADALKRCPGANPTVIVAQRHYKSQRSEPIHDAVLRFDLRTSFPLQPRADGIKQQPEWLRATWEIMRSRRSNIQFQIGACFPYQTCPSVRSPQVAKLVADVWLACAPLVRLAAIPGNSHRQSGVLESDSRSPRRR